MTSFRIIVQVLNLCDGSVREVAFKVEAESEQAATDVLYSYARDERAYRYIGVDGVLTPSNPILPPITTKYAPGEWFARS